MTCAQRVHAAFAAVCLVSAICVLLVPAFAHATSEGAGGDAVRQHDIGTLSDRYDSLNNLSNALNPDEGVVVDTRIGVLVSVNRALEGATVRFSGEAVGEALAADAGYLWVSIADPADTAISVHMSDDQLEKIHVFGGYHATGTVLEITGTYHIACNMHQGELDVHATEVKVLDNGGASIHAFELEQLVAGMVLCAVGLLLVVGFLFLRRRAERKDET